MSVVRVTLNYMAPIPVGHRVTVIPLEMKPLLNFGGPEWQPVKTMIVCDEATRIVYTARGIGDDNMTYEAINVSPPFRISTSLPPLRGTVVSCVVRGDSGDNVYMETVLGVEPDR